MKAKREHRVPLCDAAIALLQKLPRTQETKDVGLVFPGTKGQQLSDMSLTAVMRRMKLDAVPHGFRSSFRDWVGDRTDFPRDLAEFALAHAIESKTEVAYRRGDALERRRVMMTAWSAFIGYPPSAAKPDSTGDSTGRNGEEPPERSPTPPSQHVVSSHE